MPYQNDMSTLADIVGPAYAAQQAGIQNDAANQEEQARAQVAQATVPALSQAPYLANMFTAAHTAGEQGVAQQQQAAGAVAQAGVPSAIAANQAGNQAKVTGAQAEKLNSFGQTVNQIASYMDNVPAPARPAMMQQILDQNGINDPAVRQAVSSGDPEMLRGIANNVFQTSQAARQTTLGENIKGGYQLGAASIEAGSREQVAREQADARRYVADQKAQVDRLKQTTDQALAQIVSRIGTPQEQPNDRAQAQFLQQHSEQLRQMQALTTQQLIGMPVPSPDLAAIPQSPNMGQPAQAGGGQVPTGLDMDALKNELQRRGALK
jgi:hypothetical protein